MCGRSWGLRTKDRGKGRQVPSEGPERERRGSAGDPWEPQERVREWEQWDDRHEGRRRERRPGGIGQRGTS